MKPIGRPFPVACMLLVVLAAVPGARSAQVFQADRGKLVLLRGKSALPISLEAPRFVFDNATVRPQPAPEMDSAAARLLDLLSSGVRGELSFPPVAVTGTATLEVMLFFEWSDRQRVLRKWTAYRVTGEKCPRLVKEIVLDELDLASLGSTPARQPVIQPPQSYPVFLRGFFTGIEFPVASTRCDGNRAILAQPLGGLRDFGGQLFQNAPALAPDFDLRHLQTVVELDQGLGHRLYYGLSVCVLLIQRDRLFLSMISDGTDQLYSGISASSARSGYLALTLWKYDCCREAAARAAMRGEVVWCAGPWRSSGEWWTEQAWSRQEWDVAVRNEEGVAVYRIYRDEIGGKWWVEGTYD